MAIINNFPQSGASSHIYEDELLSIEFVSYDFGTRYPIVYERIASSADNLIIYSATPVVRDKTTKKAITISPNSLFTGSTGDVFSAVFKVKFKHSRSTTMELGGQVFTDDLSLYSNSYTTVTPNKGDVYTVTFTYTMTSSMAYTITRTVKLPDGTESAKNSINGNSFYQFIVLVPPYSSLDFTD